MSYPPIPLTAFEEKFFFCQVCAQTLLSKRDITLCSVCGSQYKFKNGRMRLIKQGVIPTASLSLGLEEPLELEEKPVEIRIIVPPGTGQIMAVNGGSPLTGQLTEIKLYFPDGCNEFVLVRAGMRQEQLVPVVGFIAMNDKAPTFPVRREIVYGERLWAEVQNGDALNPHTPTIVFTVRGYRKLWQR